MPPKAAAKHRTGIARVVHQLVRTVPANPADALDPALLAKVKAHARVSESHVDEVYQCAWDELHGAHAQARLLAVELCAALWARSAHFRARLADAFPAFLEATVTFKRPPKPPKWAEALSTRTRELVSSWAESHGSRLRQVALGERYLNALRGPEPATAGADDEPAVREAARREGTARLLRARFAALPAEVDEVEPQIRHLLTAMGECFSILVPLLGGPDGAGGTADNAAGARAAAPAAGADACDASASSAEEDAFDEAGSADEEYEESDDDGATAAARRASGVLRAVGITNAAHTISVELGALRAPVAHARRENSAVAESLEGYLKELRGRFMPTVQRWLATLSRVELDGDEAMRSSRAALLARAGELCDGMRAAMDRCAQLQVGEPAPDAPSARDGSAVSADDGGASEADDEFEAPMLVHAHAADELDDAIPVARAHGVALTDRDAAGDGLRLCGLPRRDGGACAVRNAEGYCPFHGRMDVPLLPAPPLPGGEYACGAHTGRDAACGAAVSASAAGGLLAGDARASLHAQPGAAAVTDRRAHAAPTPASSAGKLERVKSAPSARERLAGKVARAQRGAQRLQRRQEEERDRSYRQRFANDIVVAWRG